MKKTRRQNQPPFYAKNNPGDNQATLEVHSQLQGFLNGIGNQKSLYPVRLEHKGNKKTYLAHRDEVHCHLHSVFDTNWEMEQIFTEVDPETETLVIFGLGMGYAIEYAAKKLPKVQRVILVEPSLNLLRTMLNDKTVSGRVARVKTVTFSFNKPPEEVAQSIAQEITQNLKHKFGFVAHVAYRTLFEGYYEKMQEQIIFHIRQTQGNINVTEHNIFLKTQNILNNLAAKSLDIDHLLERMRGFPAILVSAGPSLNKNIHLLESAKDKAFVIAVGSAVKILHNKGILPHLRAAFSPYPDENVVFDGIADFHGVPLLFSNTLDYMVVKKYKASKARMTMTGDPLSKYVFDAAGIKYSLVGGGGTIANVTFDLLCRAGCSHVITIGQDLCYTDQRLYADGSWSNPSVNWSDQGLLAAKDIYGNEVRTSRAFIGLKVDFEHTIKRYNGMGIQFINATEGGLPIEGTVNRTLQEVLDVLTPQDIPSRIQDAFEKATEIQDLRKVHLALVKVQKELDQILELNETRKERLQEVLGNEAESVSKVYKALQDVEKMEGQMMAVPFYAQVFVQEVSNQLYAIRSAHQYAGEDVEKKAESLSRTLIGYTGKVFEYGLFMKEELEKVQKNIEEQLKG